MRRGLLCSVILIYLEEVEAYCTMPGQYKYDCSTCLMSGCAMLSTGECLPDCQHPVLDAPSTVSIQCWDGANADGIGLVQDTQECATEVGLHYHDNSELRLHIGQQRGASLLLKQTQVHLDHKRGLGQHLASGTVGAAAAVGVVMGIRRWKHRSAVELKTPMATDAVAQV
jgi:hypothetical protein